MTSRSAQSVHELSLVNDVLHDCWFDVSAIRFVEADRTLTIPFRPSERGAVLSRPRPPLVGGILRMRSVTRLELVDHQRVGYYDLNELVFDEARACFEIRTGIPLELRAYVQAIDVEVFQESDSLWRS